MLISKNHLHEMSSFSMIKLLSKMKIFLFFGSGGFDNHKGFWAIESESREFRVHISRFASPPIPTATLNHPLRLRDDSPLFWTIYYIIS